MNQLLSNQGGNHATGQADPRRDHQQRAIVDSGMALQRQRGSMVAFEFLRSRNVRADVIQRVLLGGCGVTPG